MTLTTDFSQLSPTTLADVLTRDRVMDIGIRPLWPAMPRIAGPAYPVRGELKGQNAGRLEFTDYGAPLHITAPSNAIDVRPL